MRGADGHFGGEPEFGTAAKRADDADFSRHHFGQTLADRQPEPGTAIFAGGGAVGLLEAVEQSRLLRFGETDTRIAHGKAQSGSGWCRLK